MTSTVEGGRVPQGAPGKRPAAGTAPPSVPAWRRKARPYLLSVPAVALIVGILYPFALGAYYSLLNYAATNPRPAFVGLENFRSVLTSGVFWSSVRVTLVFAVLATTVETVLGIAIALLLNRSRLIGRIFEKVLILPLVIAPVIAGVMWKLMFNPQFGILNHVFGLDSTFDFLGKGQALYSVVLVDLWTYTPFVALLVLAGIRSLPREPFEASEMDGASWFYMFRRLMLPMIGPYVLVAVIFRLMDGLKIFDIIQVMTSGGPGSATQSLQVGAFEDSIINFNYSHGSTYMFMLWAIVYVAAFYLVKVLGRVQRRAAGAED